MDTNGSIDYSTPGTPRRIWKPVLRMMMYAALTVLGLTAIVQAADGDRDPTFGVGGEVMTDFAGSADHAYAMAIDGNGRIVVAGFTVKLLHPGTDFDFGLARYQADGTLDGTFGSGGTVQTDFAGGGDIAWAVAIDRSGRIVVAGSTLTTAGTYAVAMARYHQDGSLDPTFGANGDGKVTTAASGVREFVSLAIDDSGRILAAGQGEAAGMLIRYHEDGSLDGSLGTGGIVTIDGLRVMDLAVANDKILVAGNTAGDVALARYDRDGSLDSSFGSGGIVRSDLGATEGIAAIAFDGSGRIVVAGSSSDLDTNDFLVARYTAQGSLDTTFNGTGYVTTDVGNGWRNVAHDVAVDASGRIVLAGHATDPMDEDWFPHFALARYREDGALDSGFGTGGTLADAFSVTGGAFAVAIDAGGKVVVAGLTWVSPLSLLGNDFALARYDSQPLRYRFDGFFAPVDNAPVVNLVKAGSAIPVKFSLNGNQGLDIFAPGSPASQPIACADGAALDDVEETLTVGGSSLTYDAATDRYTYVWKTERSWANACRQLIVTLSDGTTQVANFRFSR
jgi:uncharacterized delta-60 repeat protein